MINAIIIAINSFTSTSGGVISNWILALGSWNDSGVWDDTQVWKDS